MYNRPQIYGHSVHAMGSTIIDKKGFATASFLPDIKIVDGKEFTNPNFVNQFKNQLNMEKSQISQNSGHISDNMKSNSSANPSQKQNAMENSDLTASETLTTSRTETPCVLRGFIFGCTLDLLNEAECSIQKCLNKVVKRQRTERQLSVSSEDGIIFESSDYPTDESDIESNNSCDDDDDENEENEVDEIGIDTLDSSVPTSRKVRFASDDALCTVHPMVQWSYAYRQARMGPWERYARDSERFKIRINKIDNILKPIFGLDHRKQIYNSRFKEND